MKPGNNPFLRSFVVSASLVLSLGQAAFGADLYWDANGNTTTATGGAGTWSTANTWRTGSSTGTLGSWSNGNNAFFGGTAGAVVTGSVSLGTLNVSTGGYSFTSGTLTFSSGTIELNGTVSNVFSANLAGSLAFRATGNTSTTSQAGGIATISGNNTGLTSFELNTGGAGNQLLISNVGSLGSAGATVKLTQGVIGLSAANGSTYNAWNTEFAGGVLRLRVAGASTYSGNGTLTANTDFATITGANLIYSGTLALGSNTLTLAPQSSTGGVTLNNTISGTGNLAINGSTNGSADGLGTVTLGAANTFSGTATTTQSKGTLALNHVDALQNATLETGASGSQAVTFVVAGTNTYNIGALSGSDTLALGANTVSVGNKAGTSSFGADIGGTGGFIKAGSSSTQVLTAATSYSGATQVTGGTLSLTGSGAINSSSGITVNGATAKLLHTGSTAISPVVTLTNGTLTGTGTVNTVNVGAGTGGIISNNNGTAGAALTIGNLTLSGAANLSLFSNSTTAPLNVLTGLTTAATPATITANNSGGWTNGTTYNLITFGGGSISGSGDNFNRVVNNLSARQTPTWSNTGSAIQITINGDNPRWTGDGDAKWNTASTNNWKLVSAGTNTTYLATDDVLFDDNATGSTSIDIDSGNVAPNTTVFNNSTGVAYTLGSSGGFGISSGSLTKTNTGTLTISSPNTYTGPTSLNGGQVILSGSGTLGTGSALNLGGGSLDLGGLSRTSGAVSIIAAAANGDTIGNGSLTGTSYTASNSTGNAVVSANLLANGAIGLTKSGAGTLTLSGANTYTGTTAINGGSIVLSGSGTLGNGAALSLGGGSLDLGGLSRSVGAVSITSAAASGDTIANGNLTGTSYTAGNTTGNAIISANLLANGSAGFSMSGTGTVTLAGANTYTGSTTVTAGTLKAGSSSAFSNVGALALSGTATLDLAGNNASFTNLTSAATNTITTTGSGSGTDTLSISALGSDTGASALFTDNGTRKLQISLTSGGVGSWQVTSNVNNTFSGGLVLNGSMRAGVLAGPVGTAGAITSSQFGTGSITINGNSQVWFSTSNRTVLNHIIVNGNAGNGNRSGSFRIGSNSTALTGLSIAGNITANLADAHFGADPTASGSTLLLSGKLTGASGFRFFQSANSAAWTTTLNNATGSPNDYSGNTTINSAQTTLALGASNQIPNGAGRGNVILTSGFLDLAGFDETINGLSGGGTVDNVSAGTANTLTLGDNDSTGNTFSGLIKNATGSLSIVKIGSGNQTLSGANTFTGGLSIRSGAIIASTVNTALGGSSAGVANGLGTVTLGDTSGTNAASLLVATTGLNFANPIVLATNATSGSLSLGNTGTAISTTFSGGVTGNNDLTIISNATTGTVSLTTTSINNAGKITNTGAGTGTTTISSAIGANVTEVIENSSTSSLSLSGNNAAFLGNYSINSGRIAIGGSFSANAASRFNLGAVTAGSNNTTLSVIDAITVANEINVRAGNSGTKTITLGTSADIVATLSGKVTLDDNLVLDATGATPAASLTLSGNIVDGTSGPKGLTKNGAGVVILSGSGNDFSGGVAINAGELRITNPAALGNTTGITVTAGRLSLDGGITAGSGKTVTINGNGSNFFGALQSNSGTNEWVGNVVVGATGGTRIGANAGQLTVSGVISGSTVGNGLVLRTNNAATVNLSGSNTYLGDTTVITGTGEVRISGGADRLPTGTRLIFGASGVSGVVNLNGNSQTVAGLSVASGTANEIRSATAATLTVNSANSSAFSGTLTGAMSLTKAGSANLTLTGANTYSGATTINNGTLIIGAGGSIANSSTITIGSGATLDVSAGSGNTIAAIQTLTGIGTVEGNLTVNGTLSIGNSPGTMTFNDNLSLGASSVSNFEFTLASFTAGSFDLAQNLLGGGVTFGGTLNLIFDSGETYADNTSATIFDFSTYSGSFSNVTYSGLGAGQSAVFDATTGIVTVIPEPGSLALAALGSLAALRRRRTKN